MRRVTLRHPYLSIGEPASFGGSQSWFSRRTLSLYGCGVVGMGDLFLYLRRYHREARALLSEGLPENGELPDRGTYLAWLEALSRRYLPVIPGFGVFNFCVPFAMNRCFRQYGVPFRASWRLSRRKLLPRIEASLRADIPVLLSVGKNLLPWGKKKLTFYRRNPSGCSEAARVKGHFVVVTGIDGDYLEISSWGRAYLISWKEYLEYAGRYSSFWVCNICQVRPVRR